MVEAGGSARVGTEGSARTLFSQRMRDLFTAAGNPTLQQVQRATRTRLGPRHRVPDIRRISDWRAARNVPDRFDTVEPVLATLIFLARQRPEPAAAEVLSIAAWQRIWQDARTEEVSRAGISPPPDPPVPPVVTDNLPRDVALIGRERELAQFIDGQRRQRPVSIYTVDGMPGIGKTAFATRAAHQLADQYPDGRFFVYLHAHTVGQPQARPEDVLGGLLTNLGVDPRVLPASLESRRTLWRDRLAGKRILLVLDDAHDHAQVEPLLPNQPGCLTIVTSRKRLVALDGSQPLALDTLDPVDATALFREASRRGTAADATAIADIVALCGYLPLAIVLLGGRLAHHPAWTFTQLAADLVAAQDRLGELAAGERAVHAAFGMSYQDLAPRGRQLFRRLSLHPGPEVDRYAAAVLGDLSVIEARTELEALFTDHFLEEPSVGRFRMHDLLREFAITLSADDPIAERDAAVHRLLDYYRDHGKVADRELSAEPRSEDDHRPAIGARGQALRWLRAERANLLACLEYADSHHLHTRVVELTSALAGLLRLDGPWHLAAGLHRRAAEGAERTGDRIGAADARCDLGAVRYATGDYSGTEQVFRQALATYQETGDRIGEAHALSNLARLGYATGDYPGTAELMRRALLIYREAHDRQGEAYALIGLGVVRYATGDYATTTDLVRQALVIFHSIADRTGEAYARNELGVARYAVGDYLGATEAMDEAMAIYRENGDRFSEAYVLNDLVWVRIATGDYPEAEELVRLALVIYRETGDRLGEAYALSSAGKLRCATGDSVGAGERMERALAIFEGIGDRLGQAYTQGDLSLVCYATGDYAGAGRRLEEALTVFTEIGDRVGEAYTLISLGLSCYAAADYQRADELLHRAAAVFRDIGDRVGLAYTLACLGRLGHAVGDSAAGIAALTDALAIFTDIGDRVGEAYALSSLGRIRAAIGDTTTATELVERAIAIYAEVGDRFGQAFGLGGLALLRYVTGDFDEAPVLAERALAIFTEIGDRVSQAYIFIALGLLRYRVGDYPGALAMTEQAPAIFREIGDRLGEAYAFMGMGLVRYKTGDYSGAADLVQQVLVLFSEIDEQPGQAELLERIGTIWDENSVPDNAVVSYIDALRLVREIHVRWKKRRVWRDLPVPDVHR
ncbi:tetratricopeptide repeat protein [Nocardia sp. NPDC058658]|uniref:tetratricopeptide repeat protein n=1 Tax=Nocardia sp. NPDC058658 TaxID=3346580 RepID=UPI00364CD482